MDRNIETEIEWVARWDIYERLERIWDPEYEPPAVALAPPSPAGEENGAGLCFDMPVEEPWHVGLTPGFEKSIKGVDKKLQGRILEAVVALCAGPTTAQGDTIKPLEGNLLGLWRYRIGDYRLIYQPDTSKRRIVLLGFGSRGSAYL